MHLLSQEGCLNAGATIDEIMEPSKLVDWWRLDHYPNVRFAIYALEEFSAGSALSQEEKLKE